MYKHRPVLLDECITALSIKPCGLYVDGTLGRAGHSKEIAKRLTSGRLIAIDRDQKAIECSKVLLGELVDRVTLIRGNFRELDAILDAQGVSQVDGMLFDLGISSPQLDEAERGFSYMNDAPLDMRMDKTENVTAGTIVNTWSKESLTHMLWDFGEERFARQIATAIINARAIKEIRTTQELVDIIRRSMPAKALKEKQHPAKRSFQAIRIAVNGELESLSEMLDAAVCRLKPGGRLAVISFHSLEDRLVKDAIVRGERGCTCPRDFPVCICGFTPTLRSLTKKPITATEKEVLENPRARSAKLRVAERV